jgi:hypothetical protein
LLNVGKEIEPKKLDLKPRASGRQIRQPLRSPLGLELRRFALWFFASTFLLSMLGCATRPVELILAHHSRTKPARLFVIADPEQYPINKPPFGI